MQAVIGDDPFDAALADAKRLLTEFLSDDLRGRLRIQEAAAEYRACLAFDSTQGFAHVQYGLLLKRLGRSLEAAGHFGAGVYYEEPAWSVPNPGRNANNVRLSTLQNGEGATVPSNKFRDGDAFVLARLLSGRR